jgi:decaprenyl-phosphate phosphoribosyltransferase
VKLLKALLISLRIKQWIKNMLVFAPLFFSLHILSAPLIGKALYAFFAFCFAASAVYLLNDIFDRTTDAHHPLKKDRPIASGALPVIVAYIIAAALALLALSTAYLGNRELLYVIIVYLVANTLYSIEFKHIAVLDLLIVCSMYFLRILWGSVVIGVTPSSWIFLTILFGALFLISGKRYSEFIAVWRAQKRKVIELYSQKFLEYILIVSMSISLVCFALYTVNKGGYFYISVVPVLFAYLRYLSLVLHEWHGEQPEILLFDHQIIVSGGIWFICMALFFYY